MGTIRIHRADIPIDNPTDHSLEFDAGFARRTGTVQRIILHHDATLSARHCFKILRKRNLSTHFCIDNDGTIYQFLDPATTSAWASGKGYNQTAVAIDFSNACELKWASRYEPPRPVVEQRIHGHGVKWLGLYEVQQRACEKLCRLLCEAFGVPPVVPLGQDGEPLLGDLRPVPAGVIGHLHLTRRKFDPFGLDWMALQDALIPDAEEFARG